MFTFSEKQLNNLPGLNLTNPNMLVEGVRYARFEGDSNETNNYYRNLISSEPISKYSDPKIIYLSYDELYMIQAIFRHNKLELIINILNNLT